MTETENSPQSAAAPDTGFGGLAQSIGTRNLWIIILTMPAVFLVLVAAIIAVFGKPKGQEADIAAPAAAQKDAIVEASAPPLMKAPASANAPITLQAGEAAGAMALDGDRLALRLDGPDGVVVVIYDIAKGEEVARIPVARE